MSKNFYFLSLIAIVIFSCFALTNLEKQNLEKKQSYYNQMQSISLEIKNLQDQKSKTGDDSLDGKIYELQKEYQTALKSYELVPVDK